MSNIKMSRAGCDNVSVLKLLLDGPLSTEAAAEKLSRLLARKVNPSTVQRTCYRLLRNRHVVLRDGVWEVTDSGRKWLTSPQPTEFRPRGTVWTPSRDS